MSKVTKIPFNGQFKINYIYGDYNRSINKTPDGRHWGVDCWGIGNKNVFSASRGKVTYAGWDNTGYGNLVKVQDGEHVHFYAHLEKILVSVGQAVDYTTQIGIYGATGNVTGPHLHYEIRKNGVVIDPTTLMGIPNKVGVYNSYDYIVEVDENNGRTLILPSTAKSWRIYPLNKAPIVGNECGKLLPSKFGGLTYTILRWTQDNVAVIKTRDFGEVQIYVGTETGAIIK